MAFQKTLPVAIGALGMMAKTAPNCFADPWSSVFNRTSKHNTHGHRTYSAKGTINVIFTFSLFSLFFFIFCIFFTYIYIFNLLFFFSFLKSILDIKIGIYNKYH